MRAVVEKETQVARELLKKGQKERVRRSWVDSRCVLAHHLLPIRRCWR